MSRVSGSRGKVGSSTSAPTTTGPAKPAAAPAAKPPVSANGYSQAAKGLLAHRSSPLVSGAIKIFGDSVVLPTDLTDPSNPLNDAKYLRLLSAVLGLDELERHFQTLEGKKQEEYLAHKAEQRERRLEKLEREKEEKRQARQEEKEEEGENS